MRILHVVTHLSVDGAFGGPARVALDLARAQSDLGHDSSVLGAGHREAIGLTSLNGARVQIFRRWRVPGLGYAGWFSPPLQRQLTRELRRVDVVHVHLARDLVTLPAALTTRRAGVPYVAQTHGMVDASRNPLAPAIDRIGTMPALRGASEVFGLTPSEVRELVRLRGADRQVSQLPNGLPKDMFTPPVERPVIRYLFLARLHPRKGLRIFLEAATIIARSDPDAMFEVAGPDEGDGYWLEDLEPSLRGRVTYLGALSRDGVRAVYQRARVYVLPAVAEPFGLTIVEALAHATPVVVHATAELAPHIEAASAGRSFDGDASDLATAMQEVAHADAYPEIQSSAHRLASERWGLGPTADALDAAYRRALDLRYFDRWYDA